MTIYEIKQRVESDSYYFTRKTLKFFHQTLKDFSVRKQSDGRFYISAPMRDRNGKVVGTSERYFNPITNQLEII